MKKNGKESENEKKWDDWRKWRNEVCIEERINRRDRNENGDWMRMTYYNNDKKLTYSTHTTIWIW